MASGFPAMCMDDGLDLEIELSRRDRGNLSETLIGGLNSDLPNFLQDYISNHMQNRYKEYLGDGSVTVFEADLNTYTWMKSDEVDVDPSVSWRPDLIVVARSILNHRGRERTLAINRLQNPDCDDPPVVESDRRGLMIRVYYPIEVKSGEKVTLTEQQAEAIPRVMENSRYVHPLLAEVDISDLPESFELVIRDFEDSSFSGGRFEKQ